MSYKSLGKLIFVKGQINCEDNQIMLTKLFISTKNGAFVTKHNIFQHDMVREQASKVQNIFFIFTF